jgi:hypothetical protein
LDGFFVSSFEGAVRGVLIGQAGLLIGRDRLFRLDCPPIAPAIGLDDWSRSCEILPGKAKALVDEYGARIAAEFLDSPAPPMSLSIRRRTRL